MNGVATGIPACMYNYISYYNLVEENDIYRAYAQLNASVNENMDFHFDASYGQVKSPQVFGSPAQPVIRGPGVSTGATYQFYVPSTNPYAAAFLDQQVANGGMSLGARNATQGLSALTYRAFGHGGNPFLGKGNGYGVPSKIDNQIWRVSAGINGNLGDWAGMAKDVGYDFAVTYNQSISYADSPDVIGYRLQDALAGFGGPNCTVADDNPNQFGIQNSSVGTSAAARAALGCYYWNPFSSSFANQPELGLANPRYVAGSENNADVARWLFDARGTETINSSLTADLVFNGETGINLPGGMVGWALGGQVRQELIDLAGEVVHQLPVAQAQLARHHHPVAGHRRHVALIEHIFEASHDPWIHQVLVAGPASARRGSVKLHDQEVGVAVIMHVHVVQVARREQPADQHPALDLAVKRGRRVDHRPPRRRVELAQDERTDQLARPPDHAHDARAAGLEVQEVGPAAHHLAPGPAVVPQRHHLDPELEPDRVDLLIRDPDHLLELDPPAQRIPLGHVEVRQQLAGLPTGHDLEVDAGLGEARHQRAVDHRLGLDRRHDASGQR